MEKILELISIASHPNGDTYIEVKSVTLSREKEFSRIPRC